MILENQQLHLRIAELEAERDEARGERDKANAELFLACKAIDDRGICERDATLALSERLDAIIVDLRSDRHYAEMDAVELRRERDRLREALESAQHALKRASGLYTLGYNERHAEDQPDQVDETGISRKQYEQEAGRLCVMLSRTRDVVERALWPDSVANQAPAPRIGCAHCEGDSVCSKCGHVKIKDDDGATD